MTSFFWNTFSLDNEASDANFEFPNQQNVVLQRVLAHVNWTVYFTFQLSQELCSLKAQFIILHKMNELALFL